MCACVRVFMCVCVRVCLCMRACVRTCVRTCVFARLCVRARVGVCVLGRRGVVASVVQGLRDDCNRRPGRQDQSLEGVYVRARARAIRALPSPRAFASYVATCSVVWGLVLG